MQYAASVFRLCLFLVTALTVGVCSECVAMNPDLTLDSMRGFQSGNKRQSQQLDQALEALRAGDVSKCRSVVEAFCAANADTPHPTVLIVGLLMEDRRGQAAMKALGELSLEPDSQFECQFAFARLAGRNNQWHHAWAHLLVAESAAMPERWSKTYRQTVQSEFTDAKAVIAMGRQDWKTAKPLFETVLKGSPDSPDLLRRLGICCFHLEDTATAKRMFQRAAAADPKDERAYQARLATLHLQSKAPSQLKQAEALYKEACQRDDKTGQLARLEYGAWLQQQNRPAEVLTLLESAAFDGTLFSKQKHLQGLAHRMLGNHAAARDIFKKLLAKDQKDIRVGNQFALTLIDSEDEQLKAEGLELAKRNASRLKTSATLSTLAWALFQSGNIDQADKVIRPLTNASAVSRDVAFFCSEILKAQGHTDDASRMIKSVSNAKGPFYYQHSIRHVASE